LQKFDFRLSRVLRMREATVRAEEMALERQRAKASQLESELEVLKLSVAAAGREVKAEKWVRPAELANMHHYSKRCEREIKEYTARIAAQQEVIRKQEAVVLEARRNVRLLEKLHDQRLKEWQAEADHESGKLAEDYLASQWQRGHLGPE
jgi:flagellar export protein FliJ